MSEDPVATPPPAGPRRSGAQAARHAYVAAAAVLALAALVAAAFNGSSADKASESQTPTGERATQYYQRLVTLGRGLIVTPVGEAVLPALRNGKSTLPDGTEFRISTTKPTRVTFIKVTIVPGASIPWHHHSTPILLDLISGKLVDYRASRPGCAGVTISAGRGQFEPNTQVHTLANPFKKPAELYVVTWSPRGVEPTLFEDKVPPGCPAHPERGSE